MSYGLFRFRSVIHPTPFRWATFFAVYAKLNLTLLALLCFVVWPFTWSHASPEALRWFGANFFTDLFWVWKILILAGMSLASIPCIFWFRASLPHSIVLLTLFWLVAILLAAFQAPFPMFLWSGIPDGNDTLFFWLALPTLVMFATAALQNQSLVKFSAVLLCLVSLTAGGLALFEMRNLYWTDLSWVQQLWFGDEVDQGLVKFNRERRHGIFLTVANPNYMGSLGALLFPFLAWWSLHEKSEKNLPGLFFRSFVWLATIAGYAIIWLSASRGAWLACAASYLAMFAIGWRRRLWRGFVVQILGFIVISYGLSFVNKLGGASIERVYTLTSEILPYQRTLKNTQVSRQLLVTAFDRRLLLNLAGQDLVMVAADESLSFQTKIGTPAPFSLAGDQGFRIELPFWLGTRFDWEFNDKQIFLKLFFAENTQPSESFWFDGKTWHIKQARGWVSPGYVPIVDIPGFSSQQLSSRVYIWEATMPLLYNYGLMGAGAGQYASVFPQHDLNGKYLNFNDREILIDKPHQGYLGVWFASGLVGLGCFLALHALGLLPLLNLARNYHPDLVLREAGRFSVLAYAIFLFANDHVVQVAGVWLLVLGISLGKDGLPKKSSLTRLT